MQWVRRIRAEADAGGKENQKRIRHSLRTRCTKCENQMHHGRRIRCTVCGESDAEVGEANRERLRAGQNDGCARD